MKPYYQDASVKIYHADCRKVLAAMKPGSVDLVLTDPPYGEVNRDSSGLRSLDKGYADVETIAPKDLVQVLVPVFRGSAYIWCGIEQASELRRTFVEAGLTTRLGIWHKSNPSPMNGQYLWLSALEVCIFARRDKATFNELCKAPIWYGRRADDAHGHPTPKPEWLMRRLVRVSSNPGDRILDPFMGSGTTLRAAKDLGRKAIGIEIEERWCQIAAKRMEQNTLGLSL